MSINNPILFPQIVTFVSNLNSDAISPERKLILQPLIEFIQIKVSTHQEIRLIFICTHNSRRSHLAQIWSQTMAAYFSIKNVNSYSG